MTEFIKPVDEMLRYIEHDEVLLNGYHILDVFMCSTSISHESFGEKKLFDDFEKKVVRYIEK